MDTIFVESGQPFSSMTEKSPLADQSTSLFQPPSRRLLQSPAG